MWPAQRPMETVLSRPRRELYFRSVVGGDPSGATDPRRELRRTRKKRGERGTQRYREEVTLCGRRLLGSPDVNVLISVKRPILGSQTDRWSSSVCIYMRIRVYMYREYKRSRGPATVPQSRTEFASGAAVLDILVCAQQVGQLFISENSNQKMVRNSEQCLHGGVVKRRKVARNSLCNLPMDILSTILLLLPINDAVRTSLLSRKLKHVWCSHTNLNFDKGTMRKGYFRPSKGYHSALKDEEFVTRVDTVLQQHNGTGVEHMKIRFWLHSKHADHIDSWVCFAIASKTKEFVINLSGGSRGLFFERFSSGIVRIRRMVGEEPYCFPSQFFSPNNCLHLRCLELWSVSLQLPCDFKGCLNLKSLTLVDVSITDEDVQCMLSKCNLLEFLEIAYCSMVTSIRMLHPLDRLMHLVVDICPKLQEIDLNCSPTTFQYSGRMVPLKFASTSRLANINVVFLTYQSALSYMVTGFPSTSPRLETLTLYCYERERTIVPEGPFKFTCLRNLRLDLVISGKETRNVDVLDYAYLLKIAPFMETMELRMRIRWHHLPYCKEDGELRIGLPHQHAHLKYVRISGFFGHKDQVELALHILGSCMVLEKMVITPKLEITSSPFEPSESDYKQHYVDGHRVATEFVCKADHRNVVNVVPAETTTKLAPGPRDGEEQKRRAVVLTT